MKRSDLGWVLLLAGAIRALAYVLWTPELGGDAVAYHDLGARLAAGEGFVTGAGEPTSWRPPAYPLFVGMVYALTGAAPGAVPWFQLPVDLASVALTWWLAGRAFGRTAGVAAGVLVAVNLGTVAASGRVLSETLFTFLLLAGTAALVRVVEAGRDSPGAGGDSGPRLISRRAAWAAATGLLLGAATLTRGILVFYPLLAAGLVWWRGRERGEGPAGRHLLAPAVLLAAFLLTLVPWTVRNWRAQEAFVPVASQGGYTLYSSYHPPRGWVFGMMAQDEVAEAAQGMPEPDASRYFVRETVRSLLEEPERLPRLELLKVMFHWVPLDWEVLPWYGAFNPTYAFILVLTGLYGYQRYRGRDPPEGPGWPLWMPVAYVFALALVFYGSPRMRLPTEPFLAVFAAGALARRMDRKGARRVLAEAGGLVAALVAVAFVVEPLKALARSWITGGGG